MMRIDFFSLTRPALAQFLADRGYSTRHADSLTRAIYRGDGLESLRDLPAVPQDFIANLSREMSFDELQVQEEFQSRYDRSVKFLVELADGAAVEAVLIPERERLTLCLSSQVGCAQACAFCYTGRMGLKRNLSVGEIVGQVLIANRWIRRHEEWIEGLGLGVPRKVTNIVFMGMGEPLDNVGAVIPAIQIMTDQLGLAIGLRKISVSTAGHLDGLRQLVQSFPNVSLALSLHGTNDRERSQLMPINRRWSFQEILSFLRDHYAQPQMNRSLLIQYTLIQGVNDSLEHAARLGELLDGLPAKVNLIPFNDVAPSRFRGPEPQQVSAFRDFLHHRGIRVMVRYSKGQDIGAACGQLVVAKETGDLRKMQIESKNAELAQS